MSVEEEQAPSRTSATVICTAYLCISASMPRISAQTTVSWAKFFGTPPPTMNRPVVAGGDLDVGQLAEVGHRVDGHVGLPGLDPLDLVLDQAEAGRASR